MQNKIKWTVRNVDTDAVELVREVSLESRIPVGELLSEAVYLWYDSLADDEEVGKTEKLLAEFRDQHARVSADIARLVQLLTR